MKKKKKTTQQSIINRQDPADGWISGMDNKVKATMKTNTGKEKLSNVDSISKKSEMHVRGQNLRIHSVVEGAELKWKETVY